jgi:transposase-like protein
MIYCVIVSETILCLHCGSDRLRLDGKAPNGKQKYFCNTCKRGSRQNPKSRGYSQDFQAQVLAAYHERASLRGVCRIFGISRQTLITWLKKSREPATLEEDVGKGQALGRT